MTAERMRILKNAAMLSTGTYIEYGLGLLVSIWIARALGPTHFGEYAFAIWLCGLLATASNHALTTSSIKFVSEARGAEDADLAARTAGRIQHLQRISSAIVVVGFVVAALLLRPPDWTDSLVPTIAAIAGAVVIRAAFAMRVAISKGYEVFTPEAFATVAGGLANVALVAAWSHSGGGTLGYLVIFAALGLLMYAIVRITSAQRGVTLRAGPLPHEWNLRLNRHLWLTGTLLVMSLGSNRTIETFVLKSTGTLEQVGFFAISATLTKGAVDLLSSGLSATLLPAMGRAYGRNSPTLLTVTLPDTIRYFWSLGLAIAGFGYVVTPDLMHLLYGERFQGAVVAVQISLLAAGLGLLTGPVAAFQTISDQQWARVKLTAISLVVNLVAALAFVPAFGLNGALATLVLSRATLTIVYCLHLKRHTGVVYPVSQMVRIAIATLLATAAAAAAERELPGRFSFLASGIAFFVMVAFTSVVLRCWHRRDFELGMSVVGSLPGSAGLRRIIVTLRDRFAVL